ncbi:MAG: PLDc_N domain-containing protein [Blastochloris viridis]|uniref:PLDc_N domain-containing protein n=1 Tax=Blastochloris viridis TaxID=1079 RepID=A0A6N4RAU4_BLAVI|nr:MAG: PLDc_N domain-containing protein [Blastochloris viridis]
MLSGIIGLIILVLDIYAIVQVLGSTTTPLKKILWSLFILVAPVLGLLVWYLAGPRSTAPVAM